MTDNDTDSEAEQGLAPIEAFEQLDETVGQSYMLANDAWDYLKPFVRYVTDDFVLEHDDLDTSRDNIEDHNRARALSGALNEAQRPTADARGLLNTWPHEQVVTAADVSEILVKAIGEEPSDASYAGAGFQADAEHEDNIETLRDALDLVSKA